MFSKLNKFKKFLIFFCLIYKSKKKEIIKIKFITFFNELINFCLKTGAISIFAAIIQLLNGLLRCEPQHPKRTIFNVIHRTIGLIGFVTASNLNF